MERNIRILFICKRRNETYGPSYGLVNSCTFICNQLRKYGIWCKVIDVTDNNCIDREVSFYKPSHVFIEALWVVPSKFEILLPLHKKIKWFVRIHSKIPFLSNEGVAIDWLRKYDELSKKYHNLFLSSNSLDIVDTMRESYGISVNYHPNIYSPPEYVLDPLEECNFEKESIDIGCFGAIRPMKNQLYQALAAISFGNEIGKKIRFHINGDRVEQRGDSVLRNIEAAFENTPHKLLVHPWVKHEEFIKLIRMMDIGLQVSFSETFNIVAADFVWNNIPIIGSKDITWLNWLYKAHANSIESILTKLYIAYYGKSVNLHYLNKLKLNIYNIKSTSQWLNNLLII